ncbi:TetR/AcrR family transcriptional regulator [Cohnella nanjingensis]|uniref:TetR/AcrR family transcriptional regulator n=1 Tax=Cohnella nanjingensis TaxID=1387779 RepID=A0A7X0RUE7_9BACL|nr:TetR/AcrR family transcriptional regulator [Cohnella nanjingensis]MBB6673874.1 TetR/AcrR family transcriptional regulator [Cohnella nanjingensis]
MKSEDQANASWRYTDPACKRKLAAKLLHPMKSVGFQQLRMDDFAKHMDISKATLYKYFSSKDEIIEMLVQMFIDLVIEKDQAELPDDKVSYADRFQQSFARTLHIANYGNDPFMNDLREGYPAFYAMLNASIGSRNERLRTFYENGMDDGVFNRLNANLIILQDEMMFRHLIDPSYLMKHHLTLSAALSDYYQIKKLQLFRPEAFAQVNDEPMNEKLAYLVQKITYGVA